MWGDLSVYLNENKHIDLSFSVSASTATTDPRWPPPPSVWPGVTYAWPPGTRRHPTLIPGTFDRWQKHADQAEPRLFSSIFIKHKPRFYFSRPFKPKCPLLGIQTLLESTSCSENRKQTGLPPSVTMTFDLKENLIYKSNLLETKVNKRHTVSTITNQ